VVSKDQEKEVARHPDAAVRLDLARRADASPEILYFLAADTSSDVRRAVAENPTAPRRADHLLATDSAEDVRIVLARKIGRLIPDLDSVESGRLQELTLEVLSTLASDQLPKVRQIIAEEIKHAANVPHDIVARLARDTETPVSTPVLRYSVLLTDEDLLEIVANARAPEVLSAVSRRERLSPAICEAIVSAGNEGAIASLLDNHGAQIREDTLDSIIGAAPRHPTWHKPLVDRPHLSPDAVRRIAGFVAAALLDDLAARADLDPETERFVRQRVRERLKEDQNVVSEDAEATLARVRMAEMAGTLDDDAVLEAAKSGDIAFVEQALALKAGEKRETVDAIVRSRSARPLAALCWRAKLSMRAAVGLQRHVHKFKSTEVLNPRGGSDYPMTEEEMAWFVGFFREGAQAAP